MHFNCFLVIFNSSNIGDSSFIVSKYENECANASSKHLSVLNVLNTQNIRAVYGTTGNPNDDGYLTNPKYQAQINSYEDPQSYRDLRSVSTDSPYNYSLPRRIRLGLELNF